MGLKDAFSEFNELQHEVAKEMRAQRRRAGISLMEMSAQTGFHQNTLGKCERGELGIGLDILYGYSKVLNRPLDSFFTRFEVREYSKDNPVAELTEQEMYQYTQLMHKFFTLFSEHQIKLSPRRSFEAAKLIAVAILEQRPN